MSAKDEIVVPLLVGASAFILTNVIAHLIWALLGDHPGF